jgi:predicted O-methyltransferase YrrM
MAKVDDVIDSLIRERGDMSMFLLILEGLVQRMASAVAYDPVVVELGVRTGHSTMAILSGLERVGRGSLWSVDIERCDEARDRVRNVGLEHRWHFLQGSSVDVEIRREIGEAGGCDVAFIDTSHTYDDTVQELEMWGSIVRLGGHAVLHDTLSNDPVRMAIDHFLDRSGFQFRIWKRDDIDVGPGLTILTKRMMSDEDLEANSR